MGVNGLENGTQYQWLQPQISQSQVSGQTKTKTKQVDQPLENIIAEGRKSIGQNGVKEDKRPIRQVLSDIYTQWVDRYNPIVKASQKAKGVLKTQGAELRPENDPEYLVRRLTGAGGIADYRFNQELVPIIEQLDKAGIPKVDLDTYLAHNRMAGFGDIGRDVYGTDPVKSRQIIQALELKYPEIKQIASQFYQYQDQGLAELVKSGFLSQDSLQAMKSQNPNYAPLLS